jgi:hypothetical protein
MFAAVFGMLICSVSAVDLHPYDFDGKFTLDVPSDNFSRYPVDTHTFNDKSNNLKITYLTIDEIHSRKYKNIEEYFNESLRLDNVETDGDLIIYKDDGDHSVMFHSDDVLVQIRDDDLDEAKTIAKSVDFGEEKSNEHSESPAKNIGLESRDFYGFFKMDVPKDSDFGDTENYDKRVVADSVYYVDEVNNISINYINNDAFDDEVVKDRVDSLKQNGANVTAKDKLYLISVNEAIFHDGPKTITVISNQIDLDTLTDMASSIEITDK